MILVGGKIKELRKEKRLTQAQLAARLNLTVSSIAMYETDRNQPSLDVVVALAKLFDVTTDYLLGLED